MELIASASRLLATGGGEFVVRELIRATRSRHVGGSGDVERDPKRMALTRHRAIRSGE